jgi:DUF971 family protein
MSKRRRASELAFKNKHSFRYPAKVVAVASGTGTIATHGIVTVVAGATATQAYLTVSSGTNIGTLIGTA